MSLRELTSLIRPKCYRCKKHFAKKLNLPGFYGKLAIFCSLRCAATQGIEKFLPGDYTWCPAHSEWHHQNELKDCEEAKRLM